MKGFRRIITIFAVAAAMTFGLAGCGGDNGNYPYEPDTPAPAAHDGTFVSDHGTMVFNGDGNSVVINFDDELAKLAGVETGDQSASYYFASGDLPPHGHVPVRYDTAMEFFLTTGEGEEANTVMIDVGKYEDGHAYTGTNCTTEDRITFLLRDESHSVVPVDFLKAK